EHEAERLELFGEGLLEGRLVAGVVDLTHAWHGGIIPGRPSRAGPARWTREPFLDRGQRLEENAADDLEAPRGDLVERVLGGVPGRKVEVDQKRPRHARAQEWRVVVLDRQHVGEKVRPEAPPRRGRPDNVREPVGRVRVAADA